MSALVPVAYVAIVVAGGLVLGLAGVVGATAVLAWVEVRRTHWRSVTRGPGLPPRPWGTSGGP